MTAGADALPTVEHVAIGPVTVGTMWWSLGGQLSITICAKATFELRHGDEMRSIEPLSLSPEEVKQLPSLAVLAPVDVVPQLPRPEVTLVGHAINLEEKGESQVRLVVTRDGAAVIDKKLTILGKRDGGDPAPFARMAISYERALGGIGIAENPLGRGLGGDDRLPNVLHAGDPDKTVGCFAPLPAAFATRKRRLGKLSAKALTRAHVEIPDAFDWSYFQAAPEDQRLDVIAGDEWLWLEGLHAEYPRLRTKLPNPRVVARVYGPAPGTVPDRVPLRAESLHVDADRGTCTLVWRGSFPFSGSIPHMLVAAAFGLGDEALAWPETPAELQALHKQQVSRREDDLVVQQAGETMVIGYTSDPPPALTLTTTLDAEPRRGEPTLPFKDEGTKARRPRRPKGALPGAPWSKEKGREVKGAPVLQTLPMEEAVDAQKKLREELDRRLAESDAKKKAAAEQAKRREEEAARFKAEQEAAAAAEKKRREQDAANKRKEAEDLLDDMYGGFKG